MPDSDRLSDRDVQLDSSMQTSLGSLTCEIRQDGKRPCCESQTDAPGRMFLRRPPTGHGTNWLLEGTSGEQPDRLPRLPDWDLVGLRYARSLTIAPRPRTMSLSLESARRLVLKGLLVCNWSFVMRGKALFIVTPGAWHLRGSMATTPSGSLLGTKCEAGNRVRGCRPSVAKRPERRPPK